MNTKKILGVVAVLALIAVAMVGAVSAGNPTTGAELQAAIDGATVNTSTTITIANDIEITTPIVVTPNKIIVLDLAGHTISAPASGSLTTYTKDVNYDSTVKTTSVYDSVIAVMYNGTLTIEGNGKITSNGNNTVSSAVKLTITNESRTGSEVAALTVTNGTLEGYYYAIVGNGTRHGTAITITDGTFYGTAEKDNLAIYHPQDGTLVINGGTFSGYNTAIEMRSGSIDISAGTFTSVATKYECSANASGTTVSGSAIALSQHTTGKAISATITGGTFNGIHGITTTDTTGLTSNMTLSVTGTTADLYVDTTSPVSSTELKINLGEGADLKTNMDWVTARAYINTAAIGSQIETDEGVNTFQSAVTSKPSDPSTLDSKVTTSMATSKGTKVTLNVEPAYTFTVPASVVLSGTKNGIVTDADNCVVKISSNLAVKGKTMKVNVSTTASGDNNTKFSLAGAAGSTATYYVGKGAGTESPLVYLTGSNGSASEVVKYNFDDTESTGLEAKQQLFFKTDDFSGADSYSGTLNFQFSVVENSS